MAKTKYKRFYELMTEQNAQMLDEFQVIHDGFVADADKWETQFHAVGRDVLDVMRDWERRLCSGMERGKNALYSQGVSEKFWTEIKKRFSHIELVGLKKNSK